jgi:putative restriction endonuclease
MANLIGLDNYIERFQKLRVNRQHDRPAAPYKPALLLSVIDAISVGEIKSNRIYPTDQLADRFVGWRDRFNARISGFEFKSDMTYPFLHLRGDRFWYVQPLHPSEIENFGSTVRSLGQLRDRVSYAWVEDDLWQIWQSVEGRERLSELLWNVWKN